MILSQFASCVCSQSSVPEDILLVSRTREQGGKMAQKGDFTGYLSFNWLNGFNV